MSRSGRGRRQGLNILTVASLFILLLILAVGVFVGPAPPPPQGPGQPRRGGIYDVPVLGQLVEGVQAIGEALGNALQLSTTQPGGDLVGIGAIVGYTSTTGESQVFTRWASSGVLMSGAAAVVPMGGISVRPDNPSYRALRLYDEATGAEGEVWFQPIVAARVLDGTPVSHRLTVATKTVLVCDNGAQEVLSYNREVREGAGGPPAQTQFSRHSVRGGAVYGKLVSALARGGQTCRMQMMADYDAEVLFEGDDAPVRKTLSNVVLATFELRRAVPAGDFELRVVSNATVRPLAEVMVGGTGGVSGATRTVTFTETRVVLTTAAGGTVTQTVTRVRTETVVVATTVMQQNTVTVTVTYTPAGGGGATGRPGYAHLSGVLVERPFDAFVFARGG
jgi:hypothetical protein